MHFLIELAIYMALMIPFLIWLSSRSRMEKLYGDMVCLLFMVWKICNLPFIQFDQLGWILSWVPSLLFIWLLFAGTLSSLLSLEDWRPHIRLTGIALIFWVTTYLISVFLFKTIEVPSG